MSRVDHVATVLLLLFLLALPILTCTTITPNCGSRAFAACEKIFSFFVVLQLKGICAAAVCVWHGGNNIALLSSLSPALESTLNLLI